MYFFFKIWPYCSLRETVSMNCIWRNLKEIQLREVSWDLYSGAKPFKNSRGTMNYQRSQIWVAISTKNLDHRLSSIAVTDKSFVKKDAFLFLRLRLVPVRPTGYSKNNLQLNPTPLNCDEHMRSKIAQLSEPRMSIWGMHLAFVLSLYPQVLWLFSPCQSYSKDHGKHRHN